MGFLGCALLFIALFVRYQDAQVKQRISSYFSQLQTFFNKILCICKSRQVSNTAEGSTQDAAAPPSYSDAQLQQHSRRQSADVHDYSKLPPAYQDLFPDDHLQPLDHGLFESYVQSGLLPPPPTYQSVFGETA